MRHFTLAVCALVVANAWAAPQCSVASGSTMTFGNVVALASTPDQTTDSGTSFWINCNNEVAAAPVLFSSSARVMSGNGSGLPFKLSLVSAAGTDLPTTAPGTPLGIVNNGTNQTVTLYGKIRAVDFKALPSGLYSTAISLTIEY